MSMLGEDSQLGYENCPECGMPAFLHDEKGKRHICMREECGYVDDDEESIWSRLLRLLRLKKK